MSLSRVPSQQSASPLNSPLWQTQAGQPRAYAPNPFDSFQRSQTVPVLKTSPRERLRMLLFHPLLTMQAAKKLGSVPGESKTARLKMFIAVHTALNSDGRSNLDNLLKSGVLNDTTTDNGHSTLYQLYAILTTPRANGLDNKATLHETVDVLNKPYTITQKFAPLSENVAREMLRLRNNPASLNRSGSLPVPRPLTWNDLQVENSATCVSSSVMYYMADKKPGELARQLNELTSPMQAFYETLPLTALSPNDPAKTPQILQEHNIKYVPVGGDKVMVKVELPEAGLLRAINDNGKYINSQYRDGVEAAYQSALTFLATRSYDPATDYRDSETPGVGSKGLTEQEKTLMESIVKNNGGVGSITYQVVAGKQNPAQGEEGQSYLYGYTRSYEQTASDLINALNMGEFVIIGITETDESGAIVGGHEITVTSAFVDPKDNELKFVVVDSDDDVPKPVVRSARELIPKIHHAGLPLELAQKISQETDSTHYLKPDQSDMANFTPIPFVNDQLPEGALQPQHLTPQTNADVTAQNATTADTTAAAETMTQADPSAQPQQSASQPQPATPQQAAPTPLGWEPVYAYPPAYPAGYGYNNTPAYAYNYPANYSTAAYPANYSTAAYPAAMPATGYYAY